MPTGRCNPVGSQSADDRPTVLGRTSKAFARAASLTSRRPQGGVFFSEIAHFSVSRVSHHHDVVLSRRLCLRVHRLVLLSCRPRSAGNETCMASNRNVIVNTGRQAASTPLTAVPLGVGQIMRPAMKSLPECGPRSACRGPRHPLSSALRNAPARQVAPAAGDPCSRSHERGPYPGPFRRRAPHPTAINLAARKG